MECRGSCHSLQCYFFHKIVAFLRNESACHSEESAASRLLSLRPPLFVFFWGGHSFVAHKWNVLRSLQAVVIAKQNPTAAAPNRPAITTAQRSVRAQRTSFSLRFLFCFSGLLFFFSSFL